MRKVYKAVLFLSFLLISPISLRATNLQFHSQAYQDEFVHLLLYHLLHKQDQGTYLEIGAGDPSEINNTYFFEKKYGWKGVSLDIDDSFKDRWIAERQNPLMIEDATQANYSEILNSFPKWIDYLSLDIDHDYDVVLERIPFDEYAFKVITIEHDFYKHGDKYRDAERKILSARGYHLLCSNVTMFEDWWIHPSAFPADLFERLSTLNLNEKLGNYVIGILKNHFGIP